eukprot:4169239-Alexandrium_andersonii.AAC.1
MRILARALRRRRWRQLGHRARVEFTSSPLAATHSDARKELSTCCSEGGRGTLRSWPKLQQASVGRVIHSPGAASVWGGCFAGRLKPR